MRRRLWRLWSGPLSVTIWGAVAGCIGGDGLPRQAISGSVTLSGRLVPEGVISFYPTVQVGKADLVVGAALIEDGRFEIPRDLGLTPGKYKVAIHSGYAKRERARHDEDNPGNDRGVAREVIPRKYNSDTRLEIEIKDHAIKEMMIDLAPE